MKSLKESILDVDKNIKDFSDPRYVKLLDLLSSGTNLDVYKFFENDIDRFLTSIGNVKNVRKLNKDGIYIGTDQLMSGPRYCVGYSSGKKVDKKLVIDCKGRWEYKPIISIQDGSDLNTKYEIMPSHAQADHYMKYYANVPDGKELVDKLIEFFEKNPRYPR